MRHLCSVAIALTLLASASQASAMASENHCVCTYYAGNPQLTGDDHFRNLNWVAGGTWCTGAVMNAIAIGFGMHANDWDQGFGYNSCNENKPFGRTMNAITALLTAPTNPVSNFNWQIMATHPMIEWAGKWVMNEVDEMDGRCAHPSAPGYAYADPGDDRIDLYVRLNNSKCRMGFFHGFDVIERAATLVHEARHMSGPTHYGYAKDLAWGTGGSFEWEGKWLEQYITMGDPAAATTTMRCLARDRLKTILKKHFAIPTNKVPPEVTGC
jgi:hypothetical protein